MCPLLLLMLLPLVLPRHMGDNMSLSRLEKERLEMVGRIALDRQESVEASVELEVENMYETEQTTPKNP